MNVRSSNMRVIQKIGRTVSRKSEVPNWKLTEWTWSWFDQMAVLVRACNVHSPFHFQVRPFRNILLLHSVDIGVVRICIDAGILPQEIFTQPLTIPLSICDKNVGGITWLQARLPERKNGPGGCKIHWFVRVTCSRLLRQTLRCFWNKYDGWCSVRCVKKIYWSQRCDRCRPNGQIGGQSNSLSPRDVLVRAGYKRNLRPVSRNKVSVSLLCSRRGHLANERSELRWWYLELTGNISSKTSSVSTNCVLRLAGQIATGCLIKLTFEWWLWRSPLVPCWIVQEVAVRWLRKNCTWTCHQLESKVPTTFAS